MPAKGSIFRAVPVLCIVVMLTVGCGTDSSAGWEELRDQANELYNALQYQEALDA